MAERPILFSGPMVRAILAGTKMQTRRVVKLNAAGRVQKGGRQWHINDKAAALACAYRPDDVLWVRETFMHWTASASGKSAIYRADGAWLDHGRDPKFQTQINPGDMFGRWTPSIHMPRWAARIFLRVKSVRIERLQQISEADCYAEGIPLGTDWVIRDFGDLWDSINGKRPGCAWVDSPWVWVIEFERLPPLLPGPEASS